LRSVRERDFTGRCRAGTNRRNKYRYRVYSMTMEEEEEVLADFETYREDRH